MNVSPKYLILGVMITGGIAGTGGGARMLKEIIYTSGPGMPTGLLLVILGCVSMGVSAGYLLKEVESGEWDEVLP